MKFQCLNIINLTAFRKKDGIYVLNNRTAYPLSAFLFPDWTKHDIKNAVRKSPDCAKLIVVNGNFAVEV